MLEHRDRGFYITGRDRVFDSQGERNIISTAFGYPNSRGLISEPLYPPVTFAYYGDINRVRSFDYALRYSQDGIVVERSGLLRNSVPFQLIKKAVSYLESKMESNRGALLLNAAVNSGVLDNPDLSDTEKGQFIEHFERDYQSGGFGRVTKRWVNKLIGKEVLTPVPSLDRYFGRLIDQSEPRQISEGNMDFSELFSDLNAEEALSLIPALR